MNPQWTQIIHATVTRLSKKCPHCNRVAVYAQKRPGQFYTCKKCGHRFKEKGK